MSSVRLLLPCFRHSRASMNLHAHQNHHRHEHDWSRSQRYPDRGKREQNEQKRHSRSEWTGGCLVYYKCGHKQPLHNACTTPISLRWPPLSFIRRPTGWSCLGHIDGGPHVHGRQLVDQVAEHIRHRDDFDTARAVADAARGVGHRGQVVGFGHRRQQRATLPAHKALPVRKPRGVSFHPPNTRISLSLRSPFVPVVV